MGHGRCAANVFKGFLSFRFSKITGRIDPALAGLDLRSKFDRRQAPTGARQGIKLSWLFELTGANDSVLILLEREDFDDGSFIDARGNFFKTWNEILCSVERTECLMYAIRTFYGIQLKISPFGNYGILRFLMILFVLIGNHDNQYCWF